MPGQIYTMQKDIQRLNSKMEKSPMEKLSNKHHYCLIDGEFTADEARRVLMTLISDKIKFHQMNQLGHEERHGQVNPAVAKRIEELGQTRDAVNQLVEAARAQGFRFKINSRIDIELMAD
jgi:histidinol phosphatase-like PHP family hydrolase